MSLASRQGAPIADLDPVTKPSARISVIVPCWRDDAVHPEVAARWLESGFAQEVLIASACQNGQEQAPTGQDADRLRIIHCQQPGRGSQMNAGARSASGEMLLFHHVDTELNEKHLRALHAVSADPRTVGGAFRRRFDERHPHLRWLEPIEALRCRFFGPLFGDQSIFVRRNVFEELGGFAEIPLMEDVEFTSRLRRCGRLAIIEPAIRSSARKHIEQGRWRTTFINAAFLLFFALGVSPARLHAWYYRHR